LLQPAPGWFLTAGQLGEAARVPLRPPKKGKEFCTVHVNFHIHLILQGDGIEPSPLPPLQQENWRNLTGFPKKKSRLGLDARCLFIVLAVL
jgi:hypothetical protein